MTHPVDQPSSSQTRDKNLEEVIAHFLKMCPSESMQAETLMPWDIMVSKGAFLLPKAFRFTVAMEKQVNVFREATISTRAELEETKRELARSETSIKFISRLVTEAKKARDKALVDSARLERALDTETLRSLHRREERNSLKSEKVLLRDENQLLRGSIGNLQMKIDDAFGDGYFYTSYEVAKAFPPPFDLMASLGWDREQIEARVTQLSRSTPAHPYPLMSAAVFDPLILQRLTPLVTGQTDEGITLASELPTLQDGRPQETEDLT
ncbi:hypothetical protein LWI28_002254 [Acer negundo]|uniref:Uncharacterized protein n=1 Tax=Acer negundo TaxID=4023 RepID=A0AAD5NPG1_ACENE|nr:hypothetical protein LWI28_002254 [Acer negundo]